MRTRTFMLATAAVALLSADQAVRAQYGNMGGPAAPYPNVMAPTYLPETGLGPGMAGPQGPYAAPAFSPASYAGIGGPAPMGPGPMPAAPSMTPMASMPGMPVGPGGGGYGGGDYGGDYGGYAGDSGYCPPPGPQGWTNHYFGFGEFLYLRPRNAEVAYAVPVDSAAAGGGTLTQVGRVHLAESDYAPAFRVGFGAVISPRTALAVTYTQFDRTTLDLAIVPDPTTQTLRSLVSSPSPVTAAGNGFAAGAQLQTRFKLLDADYKGLLVFNPEWQVNYVVGARYANLEQHLDARFTQGNSTFERVLAESEFDGGGAKLGLEALRFHPTTQFFWYGRGYTSFIAGQFRARYEDITPGLTNPTLTSLNVGRLVTMLDLESGLGWQNWTGNLRFSAGYMFSAWYNTVRVNDFIGAVQANNFVVPATDLKGLVTFDGVTGRVEVLW